MHEFTWNSLFSAFILNTMWLFRLSQSTLLPDNGHHVQIGFEPTLPPQNYVPSHIPE